MYGKNCNNKYCSFNNNGCNLPTKKMFMLCAEPSKKQIANIKARIEKAIEKE